MTALYGSRIARWDRVRDDGLEHAFARRDAVAYETAYRRYGARMHATALRLLRDRDAALECMQDVFMDLWRKRNAYSAARGSLEAFLVTCARNRALERLRRAARGQASLARLEPPNAEAFDEDPIERDRIRRAIAQLTQAQAAVVELAYYRAMTLAEVASELQVPIGTVKAHLSAALRALRRALIPVESNGT